MDKGNTLMQQDSPILQKLECKINANWRHTLFICGLFDSRQDSFTKYGLKLADNSKIITTRVP